MNGEAAPKGRPDHAPESLSRARYVLAQIVRVREALEDGDVDFAYAIAEAAELDLLSVVQQLEGEEARDREQLDRLREALASELDRLRTLDSELADYLAREAQLPPDQQLGGSK